MRRTRQTQIAWASYRLLWATGLTILLVGMVNPRVMAQQCPQGSEKIGEEVVGSVLRIHCRCLPGRAPLQGACVKVGRLPERDYAVWSGQAFDLGAALREHVHRAETWSVRSLAAVSQGLQKAERGLYERAERLFDAAARMVPADKMLARARDFTKNLKRERVSLRTVPDLLGVSPPVELVIGRTQKAEALALAAWHQASMGDYDKALDSLVEALEESPDDQKLKEAVHFISQARANLAAERARARMPGTMNVVERTRISAKAAAAENLGYYLAERGQGWRAVTYFMEARTLYDDYALKRVMTDSIAKVHNIKPPPLGEPALCFGSMADAILDSLDYGKGNWQASLDYLEIAAQADPHSRAISDALNFLKGFRAGLEFTGK